LEEAGVVEAPKRAVVVDPNLAVIEPGDASCACSFEL
jgi:hypothetical protein